MSSHADRLQGCANLASTSIQMLTEHFANQHSAKGFRLTNNDAGALLAAPGLAAKQREQIAQVLSEPEPSQFKESATKTEQRPCDCRWETRRTVLWI